jgi:polar amino acid transport system substrate-binding protein
MKPRKLEEIKLAYVNQFPPFAYSRSGKSEGFGIEILDAALKEVGIKAVYVPKGLDVIKRALQSGEADGIAVYAITPERQKIYDYSDPILQTGAGLFLTVSEGRSFDLEDSAGKTVCTPKEGPLTDLIRMRFPDVNLETVLDYPAALEAVARGKADGAALNFHVGTRLAMELFPGKFNMPERMFLETPLAVAVLKGNKGDQLMHINRGLKRIKETGTLRAITDKWFGHVE